MSDFHQAQLQRHCRVCASTIPNTKYKHLCVDSKEVLLEGFGVDITEDKAVSHPPYVCHTCHTKAKQHKQ